MVCWSDGGLLVWCLMIYCSCVMVVVVLLLPVVYYDFPCFFPCITGTILLLRWVFLAVWRCRWWGYKMGLFFRTGCFLGPIVPPIFDC